MWMHLAVTVFGMSIEQFLSMTPAVWGMLLENESKKLRRQMGKPAEQMIEVGAADELPPGVL